MERPTSYIILLVVGHSNLITNYRTRYDDKRITFSNLNMGSCSNVGAVTKLSNKINEIEIITQFFANQPTIRSYQDLEHQFHDLKHLLRYIYTEKDASKHFPEIHTPSYEKEYSFEKLPEDSQKYEELAQKIKKLKKHIAAKQKRGEDTSSLKLNQAQAETKLGAMSDKFFGIYVLSSSRREDQVYTVSHNSETVEEKEKPGIKGVIQGFKPGQRKVQKKGLQTYELHKFNLLQNPEIYRHFFKHEDAVSLIGEKKKILQSEIYDIFAKMEAYNHIYMVDFGCNTLDYPSFKDSSMWHHRETSRLPPANITIRDRRYPFLQSAMGISNTPEKRSASAAASKTQKRRISLSSSLPQKVFASPTRKGLSAAREATSLELFSSPSRKYISIKPEYNLQKFTKLFAAFKYLIDHNHSDDDKCENVRKLFNDAMIEANITDLSEEEKAFITPYIFHHYLSFAFDTVDQLYDCLFPPSAYKAGSKKSRKKKHFWSVFNKKRHSKCFRCASSSL